MVLIYNDNLVVPQKTLVSVPLRGLWFLSLDDDDIADVGELVSVPLRGLWFLSRHQLFTVGKRRKSWFPSPCGDYGSYQLS